MVALINMPPKIKRVVDFASNLNVGETKNKKLIIENDSTIFWLIVFRLHHLVLRFFDFIFNYWSNDVTREAIT